MPPPTLPAGTPHHTWHTSLSPKPHPDTPLPALLSQARELDLCRDGLNGFQEKSLASPWALRARVYVAAGGWCSLSLCRSSPCTLPRAWAHGHAPSGPACVGGVILVVGRWGCCSGRVRAGIGRAQREVRGCSGKKHMPQSHH